MYSLILRMYSVPLVLNCRVVVKKPTTIFTLKRIFNLMYLDGLLTENIYRTPLVSCGPETVFSRTVMTLSTLSGHRLTRYMVQCRV